jgi:nucleoside-diphosphate-sugar epimerase
VVKYEVHARSVNVRRNQAVSTVSTNSDRLIVGCGYLGQRVASKWQSSGRTFALTRSRVDELRAFGLTPIVGDVMDQQSLRALPPVSTIVYAVGFDRSADYSMRDVYVTGLRHVLEALSGKPRIVYVSSTSVYGQTDGSWVDETSAAEPSEESGKIVLEAEATLRSQRPEAIILRFAGIYGPGRLLRRITAIQSSEPIAADPDRYLNLIHVDDGAAVLLAAAEKGRDGETYNVADDRPPTRREFYTELARLLGAPPPTFVPGSDRANRRIGNARMKREFSIALRYPSFVEGLAQAVNTPTPD